MVDTVYTDVVINGFFAQSKEVTRYAMYYLAGHSGFISSILKILGKRDVRSGRASSM